MKPSTSLLALLVLTGCPYIGPEEAQQRRDLDGDGVLAAAAGGTDCDDSDASVVELLWYADADQDGFGDASTATSSCEPPQDGGTWVRDAQDCDDTDGSVFPGVPEVCDGVDQDCNGQIDEGASRTWYHDGDGDGFGDPNSTFESCEAPAGFVADSEDCDDLRATVSPAAAEVCNGLDDDCDGLVDDEDDAIGGQASWYVDADGDGYGDPTAAVLTCSAPAGMVANADDCDDSSSAVQPGQVEVCNGVDDDCDGRVDADAVDPSSWFLDGDGDGYGDSGSPLQACAAPPGAVAKGDDCDDAANSVHPGAVEVCNGVDDDCDGVADEAGSQGVTAFYGDGDGDGHGSPDVSTSACAAPQGFSAFNDDCDDTDPSVHGGMAELCDGIDNNCNGLIDDNAAPVDWMADADGDGFGDPLDIVSSCSPPPGRVLTDVDCDDTSAAIFPGADEVCDGVDNDCDGLVDDADTLVQGLTFYGDADGDGFGLRSVTTQACVLPSGYSTQSGDCDDAAAAIFPGADEVCNGADDDCDGLVDDADSFVIDAQNWRPDDDLDGYGSRDAVWRGCAAPHGWINTGGDCDDANAAISPAAVEVCDGVDNDCDGVADGVDAQGQSSFYADSDADGYGDAASSTQACVAPDTYVADSTDCDDTRSMVNPGAVEICDGLDNDCNNLVDDGALPLDWYADADTDGYGDPATTQASCTQPAGYVLRAGDCDDADAAISPIADEVCDGLDNNCDALVDDADPAVIDPAAWFADADADGFGDPRVQQLACVQPPGTSGASSDCDDTKASIHPGADEVCNGVDDDCDRAIDDADSGVIGRPTWYRDLDVDGFGDATRSVRACVAPGGYVSDALDCDDAQATISPAADEVCNGVDDNCDTVVDEDTAIDASTWYTDLDADGFGVSAPTTRACVLPTGFSATADDCDDTTALTYPGAVEICDFKDNDCDNLIDEGASPVTWYADADGDSFGDAASSLLECAQPAGYVTDATDCDDASAAIYPGAPEVCNGLDDDCDQLVDGADPSLTNGTTFYRDADGDTFGNLAVTTVACARPTGWRLDATDCDDTRAAVHPGALEVCADGLDNDCDGTAGACTGFSGTYTVNGANGVVLGLEQTGRVGTSACAAGDTNLDGADDFWLAGPLTNNWVGVARGAVFLMESRFPVVDNVASASLAIQALADNTGFGQALAGGQDVDGDGLADLLVGASFDDITAKDAGQVYLFSDPVGAAAASTMDAVASFQPEGKSRLGTAVAIGDVNGDNKLDLLMTAPRWNNGAGKTNRNWGSAYVIYGPNFASQSVANADSRLRGTDQDEMAGASISFAGDVNGDGVGDLIVGGPFAPFAGPSAGQGRAYVVYGPPPALLGLQGADVILEGEVAGDEAGTSVAGVGDINGDGYDDLLVGAPGNDGGGANAGAAYLVLGGPTLGGTLNLSGADAIFRGSQAGGRVGASVATVGDVDADGIPDLAIGAPSLTTGGGATGAVFLVHGGLPGPLDLGTQATARFEGVLAGDLTGEWVGRVGDLNGDGYDDVLVNAPLSDVLAVDAGAVGFFFSLGGL